MFSSYQTNSTLFDSAYLEKIPSQFTSFCLYAIFLFHGAPKGGCKIKFGQKVIYKSKIHIVFFDYGNGLMEIQNPYTKSIILAKYEDLIMRLK
jgi:hypothetical protein